MRIKNKLHYILKYLVLSFPLLLVLGHLIAPLTEYYSFVNTTAQDFFNFFLNTRIGQTYAIIIGQSGIAPGQLVAEGIVLPILLYYPVYIFYVYLLDLLVDVMCFLPKFFHDLMHKEYK